MKLRTAVSAATRPPLAPPIPSAIAPMRRMWRTGSGGALRRNSSSTASIEPSRRSVAAAMRWPAARSLAGAGASARPPSAARCRWPRPGRRRGPGPAAPRAGRAAPRRPSGAVPASNRRAPSGRAPRAYKRGNPPEPRPAARRPGAVPGRRPPARRRLGGSPPHASRGGARAAPRGDHAGAGGPGSRCGRRSAIPERTRSAWIWPP